MPSHYIIRKKNVDDYFELPQICTMQLDYKKKDLKYV